METQHCITMQHYTSPMPLSVSPFLSVSPERFFSVGVSGSSLGSPSPECCAVVFVSGGGIDPAEAGSGPPTASVTAVCVLLDHPRSSNLDEWLAKPNADNRTTHADADLRPEPTNEQRDLGKHAASESVRCKADSQDIRIHRMLADP